MIAVQKELYALKVVLEILEGDFRDPGAGPLPPAVVSQILRVSKQCDGAVKEISLCIRELNHSRLAWAYSGKEQVAKLRENLETHKITLDLTLDLVSVFLLKDVKKDTEQIIQNTEDLKQDTQQVQDDLRRVASRIIDGISEVLSKLSDLKTHPDRDADHHIKRYLRELKSDAATVLDPMENQGDWESDSEQDDDDRGRGKSPDRRVSLPRSGSPDTINDDIRRRQQPSRSGNGTGEDQSPLVFTNSKGDEILLPFEDCTTWAGVVDVIRKIGEKPYYIRKAEKEGVYLLAPEKKTILPFLWDKLVRPGWHIRMAPEEDAPIRFKDALGRRFKYPFHICQTWAGMESLIKESFRYVTVPGLSPRVMARHYDLRGLNGKTLLPSEWEKVIEPNLTVRMHMWPVDEESLLRPPEAVRRGSPAFEPQSPPRSPSRKTTRPSVSPLSASTGDSTNMPTTKTGARRLGRRGHPPHETPSPAPKTERNTRPSRDKPREWWSSSRSEWAAP